MPDTGTIRSGENMHDAGTVCSELVDRKTFGHPVHSLCTGQNELLQNHEAMEPSGLIHYCSINF